MDLTFGKEELAFQQEVRDWLKENLTPEIQGEIKVGRNAYMPKERLVDWQKRLAKKGWLCTGWPKEFGGPGFTTTQKYIFEMEMAKAGAPGTSPFGPKMCAPVIMKYGSDEQKARARAIVQASMAEMKALRPAPGEGMAEMRTLLSAETIDRDRIEQHRAAHHAQAEQMSKLMTRTLADLAEVLTPAQRSEAAKSLTRMDGGHHGKPHHGRHGHDGELNS